MACYSPLSGFHGAVNPVTGKRPLVFKRPGEALDIVGMKVPCGQCVGCRLERSRQWAIRCMHEASLYEDNCFVTLTYDDRHLPAFGSLERDAFPKFVRRLRKSEGVKVRYYHAGEYGDRLGRPHYHGLLFGYDFSDKVVVGKRGDHHVYRSEVLRRLWPSGLSELGSVSFESAAYVARYIMKKMSGPAAEGHYERVDSSTGEVRQVEREFTSMSRRPGIGRPWLDSFGGEVYPEDGVVVRGRLMKPPRFYDLQFEMADPSAAENVRRVRRMKRVRADESIERMADREKCAEAKLGLSPRRLE